MIVLTLTVKATFAFRDNEIITTRQKFDLSREKLTQRYVRVSNHSKS